ncbi:MAG: hypothetical protein AABZ11_03845, partial [Nitrospinota bacterium]
NMPEIKGIPDITGSLIEHARRQRRRESAVISEGGMKSGREIVRDSLYRQENIRNVIHSSIKEDAVRNIAGEETRFEREVKEKEVKLSVKREQRHDTIREKFIKEEGKGAAISIVV